MPTYQVELSQSFEAEIEAPDEDTACRLALTQFEAEIGSGTWWVHEVEDAA